MFYLLIIVLLKVLKKVAFVFVKPLITTSLTLAGNPALKAIAFVIHSLFLMMTFSFILLSIYINVASLQRQ